MRIHTCTSPEIIDSEDEVGDIIISVLSNFKGVVEELLNVAESPQYSITRKLIVTVLI